MASTSLIQGAPSRSAAHLLQTHVFRIGDLGSTGRDGSGKEIGTGFKSLDQALYGGGWARPGLTEILCNHLGVGELSLLLKGLGLKRPAGQWEATHLLWVTTVAESCIPYAPALAQFGLNLKHLAIVRARDNDDALWAAEQGLKSGACRAVLMRMNDHHCNALSLRRLMQAAIAGGSAAFLLRPLDAASSPSPAGTRLALHPEKAGLLRMELLKRRGLPPGKTLYLASRQMECLGREPIAIHTKSALQRAEETSKTQWLDEVLRLPAESPEVQVRSQQPDAHRR